MNHDEITEIADHLHFSDEYDKYSKLFDYVCEAKDLEIEMAELKDFCIWLTGCGYDFCQHDHFVKQRDKLLLNHNVNGSESIKVETVEG